MESAAVGQLVAAALAESVGDVVAVGLDGRLYVIEMAGIDDEGIRSDT